MLTSDNVTSIFSARRASEVFAEGRSRYSRVSPSLKIVAKTGPAEFGY